MPSTLLSSSLLLPKVSVASAAPLPSAQPRAMGAQELAPTSCSPGHLWLEFELHANKDGNGSVLHRISACIREFSPTVFRFGSSKSIGFDFSPMDTQ